MIQEDTYNKIDKFLNQVVELGFAGFPLDDFESEGIQCVNLLKKYNMVDIPSYKGSIRTVNCLVNINTPHISTIGFKAYIKEQEHIFNSAQHLDKQKMLLDIDNAKKLNKNFDAVDKRSKITLWVSIIAILLTIMQMILSIIIK